jgi:8-oxo-dGTP pyrophosphatase MutT (NUDIX family)
MNPQEQRAPVRYHDLPLVEIVPLGSEPSLRVVISREDAPEPSEAARREWDRLAVINPRLFPGQILAFLGLDELRREILARRDSYVRLAVQPTVTTGARLLSVTAILLALDKDGREHIFLGKRADSVRAYPGLWEIGPSGGVGVPPRAVTELDADLIAASALDEIAEEIGLTAAGVEGAADGAAVLAPQPACALLRDHGAMSDDIVVPIRVGVPLERVVLERNWEYSQTRWVPRDAMAAFGSGPGETLIPPSAALLRWLARG